LAEVLALRDRRDRLHLVVKRVENVQIRSMILPMYRASHIWRDLVTWLLLASVYALAGKLGLALAFVNASATAVWPPTGIALAAILLLGPRAWPGIFLGAFFVNQTTAGTLSTSLAIAVGNTLEALIGAYGVNLFAGGRSALNRGKGLALFVVIAALMSTAIGATVGVTSLSLAGFAPPAQYGRIWLTWWLGDAAGAVVVAPTLLLWAENWHIRWSRSQLIELSLVVLSLIGVGWVVFVAWDYPIGFLTIPVCIWAAFRFGQREAATSTCVLSVLATWATVHGYGSFATTQSPNAALLELQLFMAVTSIVGIAVSGAVDGRRLAEDAFRRSHAELESTVEARTREVQSALEKLHSSDVRFVEAQQLANIGSWEWNRRDNSETWSDELFRIFDFEPQSFAPNLAKFVDMVHPDDREKISGIIDQALQNHEPFEFEHRIVRPDGEMRTLRAHGRVVVDEHGEVLRILGTAQDITARKEAEEIVRRSERRLQTIVDAEPACVKLVSPDGLLLDMNPAGLQMIGAESLTQVVGRPIIDLVHPADRSRYVEMHRAASGGSPARWEFRIVGLSGGERWVDSHMVPFETSANGHKTAPAVLGVTSDVTERKRLEDQLRQSQKMDALGRLAGGITHDFNNFLTALIGYTELALRQIGDDETVYPDLKNDLREVLKIGRRAAALTRQLLIFSRSPMLEPAQAVSFDAIIAPLDGMLKQLLGGNVRVQTSLQSGETRVRIDPRHLEQLVVNLATNARDAMRQGGVLTIETAVVHLDDAYAAGKPAHPLTGWYVQLAVSDTGVGMDDNVKAHLFEPFFTTKEAGEGTGLGLATVYGIVKQSNGYIWVYSEPRRGTTFKLYFPLMPEPSRLQTEQNSAAPDDNEQETILVVDDDEDVRAVARDVLRENDYRVLEARTGEEAEELAARYAGAIHLIVTDVIMPGMTGRELVVRLRRTRRHLCTLFMSGYGHCAIAQHGVLESNAILLEKPFTSDQLLKLVRTTLASARQPSH
jgi:two-component system cell cycle sensor histidine kinase/response regulator CckA